MKIVFYADHPYYGQLSNNGGTRTILKSAEVLRKLGHKVDVVAHKDKFTWFKHPKPIHRIPKDTDVIIAVSISDIEMMCRFAPKRAKKFYWMREFALWRMKKENIINTLRKSKVKILCNSIGLQRKIGKYGIKSSLCYAGLDI